MNAKEVWSILLCAAEAAARTIEGELAVAIEAIVEEQLSHNAQLTPPEVRLVRHAAFDLSRFATLCDGAFKGYCSCFKRNGSHRAAMYLIAYLIIFQYHTLGESAVCELLDGCMSHPRLCEYLQYLFTTSLVTQFSIPLWRTTYDDPFVQQQVIAPLAAAAKDAGGDVAGWLRRHISSTTGPSPDSFLRETPAASAQAPRSATSTTNTVNRKAGRPPQLHTSAPARRPSHEACEMAVTAPAPTRLPRIKDAQLPSRPRAAKAPTKPIGFTFHQRAASPGATAAAASPSPSATATITAVGAAAAVAAATTFNNDSADTTPRPSSSQLRRMLNTSRTVPTTTAVLRREACMRDRQRTHAEKALTELEVVARDATEYELWRQAQAEEEERAREMRVVQRHLDAVETEERRRTRSAHAAELRRRRFRNLRTKYQEELEARKSEEAAARRQQEQAAQHQRTQQLYERVAALERTNATKATLAAQVKQESEDLRAAAQEAKEERQTQQALLIQEIHVMQQRIRERKARMGEERRRAWADGEVDAALGRMSVAELHEALERIRAEDAAEMEARHAYVTTTRAHAQAERDRLEEECASAREQQRQRRQSKQTQRAEHKAAVEEARASRETARMMQLHEKLEARRQEARAVQRATREAERQRRNESLLRAQDSTSMEQGRWHHYEAGLVRRSKWEQQRTLQEAQNSV
ncbi:hypothetical protein ABB37_00176 [Leptomonas pyrrhocoris]|uniref:Uncharacterized protein n=1 Tax=Leptomonas pyrrhocoris TaxID=157538 RepID=A0A0M9GA83_LEPPY|nr:hypothetical protein ABB37_00176 [Leptomonas pyrrhocoris]KPA85846.1 hypothetical protein ABB37_00176 [Leptomonas pyrrhocoris]|eukprot:XP_015664285.1 hypothetical protein ABB37_00176 [Leptomonas pyrrhocoris]